MNNAVTVIGLGLMGRTLATRLSAAGFETTVWNRTMRSDTVGETVRVAPSVGAAISASPTTLVCVADNSAVEAVLTGGYGPVDLTARDIINLTTGMPDEAEHLGDLVGEAGGNYLAGVIAAFPDGIGNPDTQLILGGDKQVWRSNEQVLLALGGASWWSGPSVRQPAILDIAVALNFYHVALAGFLTSLRYAVNNNVPTEHLMRVVEPTIPTLLARMNSALSEMERKDFRTNQATVDVHLAALEISVTAMGPHGNLLLPLIEFLRQAQIAGDGTLSFAAFTEHII